LLGVIEGGGKVQRVGVQVVSYGGVFLHGASPGEGKTQRD